MSSQHIDLIYIFFAENFYTNKYTNNFWRLCSLRTTANQGRLRTGGHSTGDSICLALMKGARRWIGWRAIAVAMLETLVEKNILSVADARNVLGRASLFPVNIPQFRRDEKLWQLSESCNMGGSPRAAKKNSSTRPFS